MNRRRSVPASRTLARLVSRLLAGATDIREGEGRAVLASAAFFFLVLAAVMVLRPVREAIGLESGIETVRVLFLGTMGAMILLVPIFGYLVSHVSRQVFLSVSYHACAGLLLVFYFVFTFLPADYRATLGSIYYVTHSVLNLFLVSLFWALMADLFSLTESKRLFPAIAVGGTLGAISGSVISWQLADRIGVESLFLVAVGLLELAVWMTTAVAKTRAARAATSTERRPIGGHSLAAVTSLVRSPYLIGIGLFVLLTATISTFLYFTELRFVRSAADSVDRRTALFANINIWTQVATLVAQAFLAGRIMRFVGVGTALALLPLYCVAGFSILAATPTLAVYTLVNAVHKAVQRGITRPARETLFTVLAREDKYKAKSFLDTFVSRAGDAGGSQLEGALAGFGLGSAGLLVAVFPIAAIWIVLSVLLGSSQRRRDRTGRQTW